MTFIVVSKDDVLSDNVATLDIRLNNRSKCNVTLPYNNVSKISKIKNRAKLAYGERIQAITIAGKSNSFSKMKTVIDNGVDLKSLVRVNQFFNNIFDSDTCLIAICENSITNWTTQDKGVINFSYTSHEDDELLFFGSGKSLVNGYYEQLRNNGYKPTALDMMLLVQSISENYGNTFDWFNRKTETLQENILVNDKTRVKVLNNIKNKLDFLVGPKNKLNLINS